MQEPVLFSEGASGEKQHTVLWDTTHGVYLTYWINGSNYTNLQTHLDTNGYTVTVIGSGVNSIDLSPYDVIVINLGSAWNSAYTTHEVDSLIAYINEKCGRVLLTTDINFCSHDHIFSYDNATFTLNLFNWLSENGGIWIGAENTSCPFLFRF